MQSRPSWSGVCRDYVVVTAGGALQIVSLYFKDNDNCVILKVYLVGMLLV